MWFVAAAAAATASDVALVSYHRMRHKDTVGKFPSPHAGNYANYGINWRDGENTSKLSSLLALFRVFVALRVAGCGGRRRPLRPRPPPPPRRPLNPAFPLLMRSGRHMPSVVCLKYNTLEQTAERSSVVSVFFDPMLRGGSERVTLWWTDTTKEQSQLKGLLHFSALGKQTFLFLRGSVGFQSLGSAELPSSFCVNDIGDRYVSSSFGKNHSFCQIDGTGSCEIDTDQLGSDTAYLSELLPI